MATYFLVVLQTVVTMFILMFVGAFLFRINFLSNSTINQISNILLKVASPALVVSSFLREYNDNDAKMLGETLIFVLIAVGVSFIFATVLYREGTPHWKEKKLGTIFTNNAFMAFPLLDVLFGTAGIFLGSVYFSVSSTLLWLYGANVVSGNKKFNYKNIVFNPNLIAVVVGLIFLFSNISLPDVIRTPLASVGSLNTPLSMFILGAHLAQSDIKGMLKDFRLITFTIVTMLIIPLVVMGIFLLIPFDSNMAMTVVLVGVACPVGAALSMLFEIFHKDPTYISRLASVTTILSLVTLPVVLTAFQVLDGKLNAA